jgi:phosphate transport system substrate-binding protein
LGDLLGNDSREKIEVFTREEESGAAGVWASFVYSKVDELRGTKVTGDDAMISKVGENPLALGYCNLSYAFDRTTGSGQAMSRYVPVDLDYDNRIERKEMPFMNLEEAHRSLWLGFFPDVLCRELTIGSMGKPTDEVVVEFIRYILTEGQNVVRETGYCGLNNVYIQNALDRLN